MSRARILIVAADSNFRGAVAEYLNADGFEVVEAEDGVDALEKGERTVPTAVAARHHHAAVGGASDPRGSCDGSFPTSWS